MEIQQGIIQGVIVAIIIIAIVIALSFKPLRKTIGLLLVILGFLACLSFIGIIFGIPLIIIGGLLLFI